MARQHTNLTRTIFFYLFLIFLYILMLWAELVVSGLVLFAIRAFCLFVTGSIGFVITARLGSSGFRTPPPVVVWLSFVWGLSIVFESIFHSFDAPKDSAYFVAAITSTAVSGIFFAFAFILGYSKREKP